MQDRRLHSAQWKKNPLRLVLSLWLALSALAAGAATTTDVAQLHDAIAALQKQPLTEVDRQRVMDELNVITKGAPNSEPGISATYLLGRVRQLNGEAEEPPEFHALIREHPQHPLAQLARVKLLMRQLYAVDATPPAARLKAAEAMGRELTLPVLQSDFHLVMGDAYVFFGDQRELALAHFVEAERLGISGSATRGTVLVQIGELAQLTGDPALAARSYRAFLDGYPRDIRQQIVRDRLAEVEARP